MKQFEAFFQKMTSHFLPHAWQHSLARQAGCGNRLIRVPTGFGKTLGILSVWIWHRLISGTEDWPRRLVWCLPMRVLVEQTEQEVRRALQRLGLFWDGGDHAGRVGVHLLMGGADAGEWHLYPEDCAVLIGTQDMLLSRAMNRGYGTPRARWPMEFGLLNQDCLWIMDEVQLMDVGLATSAQMQAFRDADSVAGRSLRPSYTWWMSATLQPDWLRKSPDTGDLVAGVAETRLAAAEREGRLWEDTRKPCRRETIRNARELARLIGHEHGATGQESPGLTLVVVNTVDTAVAVYDVLCKDQQLQSANVDIRLIHSRFRPAERILWRDQFLHREACRSGVNRIIVATQVVEAGVDISADLLITELAPWASLVQRFGRCARWGGEAEVIVADLAPKNDKAAAPYTRNEIDAAREALQSLSDVAPLHLEAFEERHAELLPRLYPFDPLHLLLRHELDELFDTTPDLSGADIDISRFIRSGEERDLQVFWTKVQDLGTPPAELQPTREALCAVPFLKARDWLCGRETATAKAPGLKKGIHAWVWDWLDGTWRRPVRQDLYPGRRVMVESRCGGYEADKGWSPTSTRPVAPTPTAPLQPDERADSSQDDEALSALEWQTIAVHGSQTGALAGTLAEILAPQHAELLDLAGRWHDAGKIHPAFNNSIGGPDRPSRRDLAKAPQSAWLDLSQRYQVDGQRRPGFRHELASALSLLEVLKRYNPDHPALLGPWRTILTNAGKPPQTTSPPPAPPTLLEQEILDLDADSFNLVTYLVCAHHGKVRLTWHACPADQAAADELPRIRGLKDGDLLPSLLLAAADRSFHLLPEACVDLAPATAGLSPLTGPSWTERVLTLLDKHGPFTLAWLEALLRAADQRTSRTVAQDELLDQEVTQ